jgi:hypothetical protein
MTSSRPTRPKSSILQVLVAISSVILRSSSCSTAAAAAASTPSSFYRDVVVRSNPLQTNSNNIEQAHQQQQQRKQQQQQQHETMIHAALLEKAMLRTDFEAKYGVLLDADAAVGGGGGGVADGAQHHRKLDEEESEDSADADDYYMNYNSMYSFSGYSMKFAKCQPVQYFSEYAMNNGKSSYSPMITDDIVILRLCPTSSCKSTESGSQYGCQYNFAEYAIELSDYVRIMLRYSSQKRDYMCTYCESCLNGGNGNAAYNGRRKKKNRRRRLEEEQQENEEEQEGEAQEEQQQQQQQGQANNNGADDYYRADDDYVVANDADDAAATDAADDYYKNACSTWNAYCTDYADLCFFDDSEDNNYNQYLDYDDYLDYLDCAQVEGNTYYVRPRCDGYQGTIKMAVYYDQYCVQYAGNEVSLKNLGLGFRESAFSDFYSGQCLDCAESVSATFFSSPPPVLFFLFLPAHAPFFSHSLSLSRFSIPDTSS